MKDPIIEGNWYYYVHVSKDSPKNIYRGMWGNLPDTEAADHGLKLK